MYRELLDIYRQPQRLHQLTGPTKHWWGEDKMLMDAAKGKRVQKQACYSSYIYQDKEIQERLKVFFENPFYKTAQCCI